MITTLAIFLTFACAAWSEPQPNDALANITIRGKLLANGAPMTAAEMYLTPIQNKSFLNIANDGKFEFKALIATAYRVELHATDFATMSREINLNEKGVFDLGTLVFQPIKKVTVSAIVAQSGTLKTENTQTVELQNGACANIRAQDESGCLLSFCLYQQESELVLNRSAHTFKSLGKISLAKALTQTPRGGTFVTHHSHQASIAEGETLSADTHDAYCAGLIHIDSVK